MSSRGRKLDWRYLVASLRTDLQDLRFRGQIQTLDSIEGVLKLQDETIAKMGLAISDLRSIVEKLNHGVPLNKREADIVHRIG